MADDSKDDGKTTGTNKTNTPPKTTTPPPKKKTSRAKATKPTNINAPKKKTAATKPGKSIKPDNDAATKADESSVAETSSKKTTSKPAAKTRKSTSVKTVKPSSNVKTSEPITKSKTDSESAKVDKTGDNTNKPSGTKKSKPTTRSSKTNKPAKPSSTKIGKSKLHTTPSLAAKSRKNHPSKLGEASNQSAQNIDITFSLPSEEKTILAELAKNWAKNNPDGTWSDNMSASMASALLLECCTETVTSIDHYSDSILSDSIRRTLNDYSSWLIALLAEGRQVVGLAGLPFTGKNLTVSMVARQCLHDMAPKALSTTGCTVRRLKPNVGVDPMSKESIAWRTWLRYYRSCDVDETLDDGQVIVYVDHHASTLRDMVDYPVTLKTPAPVPIIASIDSNPIIPGVGKDEPSELIDLLGSIDKHATCCRLFPFNDPLDIKGIIRLEGVLPNSLEYERCYGVVPGDDIILNAIIMEANAVEWDVRAFDTRRVIPLIDAIMDRIFLDMGLSPGTADAIRWGRDRSRIDSGMSWEKFASIGARPRGPIRSPDEDMVRSSIISIMSESMVDSDTFERQVFADNCLLYNGEHAFLYDARPERSASAIRSTGKSGNGLPLVEVFTDGKLASVQFDNRPRERTGHEPYLGVYGHPRWGGAVPRNGDKKRADLNRHFARSMRAALDEANSRSDESLPPLPPDLEASLGTEVDDMEPDDDNDANSDGGLKTRFKDRGDLLSKLRKRIVGQDAALERVVRPIMMRRIGIHDGGKPIAGLLLAGPSGVGKTETATALAEILYGSEEDLIRIDCSSLKNGEMSVSSLLGSGKGYVGSKDGGRLTNWVKNHNGAGVIVFDEIEKADPEVWDAVLLPMLDYGKITDASKGVRICSNCIVILTSNIGTGNIRETGMKSVGFGADTKSRESMLQLLEADVRDSMAKTFRPELIGRLTDVIVYNPLTREDFITIFTMQWESRAKQLFNLGVNVDIDDSVVDWFADHYREDNHGVRVLGKMIDAKIVDRLVDDIISSKSGALRFQVSMDDDGGVHIAGGSYDPWQDDDAPLDTPEDEEMDTAIAAMENDKNKKR